MDNEKKNTGTSSKSSDLKQRIIFTILILSVYRLGTYIPLPGIDPQALQQMMSSNQQGLLGMFNVFAGGAVSRMAIFALGIMPYISSSIIIQLLTGVSEYFKSLKNQGEVGRKKITQYTRYGTVLLATVQGYGVSVGLENASNVVIDPGFYFKLITVINLFNNQNSIKKRLFNFLKHNIWINKRNSNVIINFRYSNNQNSFKKKTIWTY